MTQAERDRIVAQAQAKHDSAIPEAWAEWQRAIAPARAERDRTIHEAGPEYQSVSDEAEAEFERTITKALAEHWLVVHQAQAELERVIARAEAAWKAFADATDAERLAYLESVRRPAELADEALTSHWTSSTASQTGDQR